MSRLDIRVPFVVVLAALTVANNPVKGQGQVSGQVSILERPGEKTTDLGNAVIYLESTGPAAGRPAATTQEFTLQSREITPHVRVLPAGSRLEITNQDPFSHNVFSKAAQGPFDTDVFGRGKKKTATVKEAGVYPLYCNVHPRMTAFVVAVNTPWYTQAGADGRFAISGVPAGSYVLHVWHERGQEQKTPIVVTSAGAGGLKYQLDARNYKYVQHKNKNGKDYTNAGDIY